MASELNLATASAQALDMSVFGLFMMADPVVKAVMLLLIGASVWCWAIIFDKMTRIRRQKRGAEEFDDLFWSGGSLDDLYNHSLNSNGINQQSGKQEFFENLINRFI